MSISNWMNPDLVLPKEGDIVWALLQHNKSHNPLSCEIICGEVSYSRDNTSCRVDTMDFTGKGGYCVYLLTNEDTCCYEDKAIAWCPKGSLELPNWVRHDSGWDAHMVFNK